MDIYIMQIDKAGLEFIESLEGFRAKPYKCSAGVWTIGIGSTMIDGKPVTANTPAITRDKALELLREYVDRVCAPRLAEYRLNQNQYNAMCSFQYNIGGKAFDDSTVRKLLGLGMFSGVPTAMMMWVKPAELIGRRTKERQLFEKAVSQ